MTRKIRPEKKVANPGCLLGRWPDGTVDCCVSETQCVRCGWNPEVDRRRRLEVREKYRK